jgi:serine/threonine-protein kinase
MLVERYLLEEQIASGGMTSLWRARDEVLARHVAVKILHPHLALDDAFRERFLTEALAAAHLSHPNIAQIYDTGSDRLGSSDEQHFIVLEYCGGGSVENLTEDEAPLAEGRVTAIASVVCDALTYAHTNGVVHGDLRPANILLTTEGGIKVADFGIARAAFLSRDVSTTGTILGSVRYLSPEQAEGKEPDEKSDIYSLGVVVYELLVGRPPFEDATDLATVLQHLRQPPPPLRSIRGGIPRALDAAVLKALAKDPEDRYASAREMQAALTRAAIPESSGQTQVLRAPRTTSSERADTPIVRSTARSEFWRIAPVLALIAIAVVVALLVPRFLEDDKRPSGPTATTQEAGGGGQGSVIEPTNAVDFDPQGGDGEHPDEVPNASDGDPDTAWTTSDYADPLQLQKNGVGLLFDLGGAEEVARIEILTDTPGMNVEIRSGDQQATDETGLEVVDSLSEISARQDVELDGTSSRYWLVWITQLPGGGGGSASINEVRFFAP